MKDAGGADECAPREQLGTITQWLRRLIRSCGISNGPLIACAEGRYSLEAFEVRGGWSDAKRFGLKLWIEQDCRVSWTLRGHERPELSGGGGQRFAAALKAEWRAYDAATRALRSR